MLDARKKAILFVAVQEYILTAEPVSSQRLVEKYQLGVSSATVRNELAWLENMGYLHQPHTSAGRIPTDAGYRYYVNSISDKPGLTSHEERAIIRLFSVINMEMEELIRETAQILSNFTNHVAIALAPPFKRSILKHIDLVLFSPRHMLIVLITDKGQVLKRTVSIKPFSKDVGDLERLLNERLQGLGQSEISGLRDDIDLPDQELVEPVRALINAILDIMMSEDKERVFLSGTESIFYQPEFEDLRRVQILLSTLEHGYRLMQWLEDSAGTQKVLVRIGSENPDQEIKDCSVVASSYKLDDEIQGTLGIIGPTRMNYARAISAVGFVSDSLSRALIELRH
ncbi:MAG: heat-inducible transcription repressor HrcA [Actinobacteria bacterium]|nr:heat-inducible transcription repressor HrcA [Actinomycetota bacterium]